MQKVGQHAVSMCLSRLGFLCIGIQEGMIVQGADDFHNT
jgi:hypothetical protein